MKSQQTNTVSPAAAEKKSAGRPANPDLKSHLLDHAMKVLLAKGLSGFSMISVAKSAKASKETLYRHFGDKQGLLYAAIERDAGFIDMVLTDGLDTLAGPEQRLLRLASNYLTAAYTDHAIALQRLAYADGEQGLGPLFVKKITYRVIACVSHEFIGLDREEPERDAELFLGLVQGKLYNKILFGVPPDDLPHAIERQVADAWRVFNIYLKADKE
jgi:TetR/AcrR family transcriptional repressor of mexJK operon